MSGHYCNGLLTNIITRSYMGQWAWEWRHRTAMPGQYDWTSFQSTRDSHDVNQPFWEQLDLWARNMNFWANNYGKDGTTEITWFGEVGIINCSRSSSAHNRGRGYDLCRVTFNPYYCDSNRSHTVNQLHKRRYVSVAAALRRYFQTVITAWYDPNGHWDHIHVDDLSTVGPIRKGTSSNRVTDTYLMQEAMNVLNGESLAVDGWWGSGTQAAYDRFASACRVHCYDPFNNTSHAKVMLSYVVRHGIANAPAGTYTAAC